MSAGQLIVVTGIMAAGKSTVAQALAERFDKSVHVRGDQFRRFVVRGREDMSGEPSDEALAQLRLRYRLAVEAAQAYCDEGFTTVLQDVVIGSMLAEFIAMIDHRPLHLVVLAPSVDEVARREAARPKTGYGSITPADLDDVLRDVTPRWGLWLDSSDLTVDETVQYIADHLGSAEIP